VRALLDTHALLWWLVDDPRLGDGARGLLEDAGSGLYFSAASSWELAIKVGLGRLKLPDPPRKLIPRVLREQAIRPLDVTHAHALAVAELPPHHRDPFDRMLVAQARLEKLAVVTGDPEIARYGVRIVW
jgi:PIN domain nuclease of toxin-antitoxin system